MSLIYRRSIERFEKDRFKQTYAVVGPLKISAMVDWGKDDFFISSCFSTNGISSDTTTPSSTPSSLFEDIVENSSILKIDFCVSKTAPVWTMSVVIKYTHTAAAAASRERERKRGRDRDEEKKIWEWWMFFSIFVCVRERGSCLSIQKKRKISRTYL